MENKKSLHIDSKVHKELKKKVIDEDTTIEQLATKFIKAKLEEEGDLIE